MWKLPLSIFTMLLVISGCGVENDNSYSQVQDESGRQFVNNDLGDMNDQDALDTRQQTNQNPNFIDLNRSQPTLGSDVEKAREVIELYTDYAPGSVWMNGQKMWVTAHTDKRLSDSNREVLEAKLHKRLIAALPSYKIDVKIEGK
ncbi:hypothetical protein [Bacillus sp. 2205SS5-2]|uniref:hypothetical protein n=1 Tax=Bacillus sp. 2205SS5-2 TaxID=3109031 RepID=UPI0030071F8F